MEPNSETKQYNQITKTVSSPKWLTSKFGQTEDSAILELTEIIQSEEQKEKREKEERLFEEMMDRIF